MSYHVDYSIPGLLVLRPELVLENATAAAAVGTDKPAPPTSHLGDLVRPAQGVDQGIQRGRQQLQLLVSNYGSIVRRQMDVFFRVRQG